MHLIDGGVAFLTRLHKIRQPYYEFYITNQIIKPCLQLYALILEQLDGYKRNVDYKELKKKLNSDNASTLQSLFFVVCAHDFVRIIYIFHIHMECEVWVWNDCP